MRVSNLFAPTLKEIPQDAEIESHRLMLRAGFIRKLASGIYSYLPLAVKTLEKIIHIIKEEHERIGCQEILMPAMHPAEIWHDTGRWNVMGETMFRLKDRHNRDFCLGMTHEEIVTTLIGKEVHSYKQLPMSVYQIQTKFRDEPRPRSGVIRAREFIMKDAYSFHTSFEDLDREYEKFYSCYTNIFKRSGLNIQVVEADTGAMGGFGSQEFMVMSDAGEDILFFCEGCGYAANGEKVECLPLTVEPGANESKKSNNISSTNAYEKIHTPSCRTIEELTKFLSKTPASFIKTLMYEANGRLIAVLLRGDREINESKLARTLGAGQVSLATPDHLESLKFSYPVGFLGPIGLSWVEIIADYEVKEMADAIVGANEADYHFVNVSYGRDFSVKGFYDLRLAVEGDSCPKCDKPLTVKRGIEIGHIFKLGTKYSSALNANFLNETGEEHPMIMGCYGIGVSRMIACLIEQHHDKDGIIWPAAVAPYQVYIVVANSDDEAQSKTGNEIYVQLQKNGYEVLLDNRHVRAGVKFKDADLIGIPLRITIGAKLSQGNVELRPRKTGVSSEVPVANVLDAVKQAWDSIS